MLYTAPPELEGLISLVAIVNGKDTAYADIDISDCACYWEINAPDGYHTGVMSIALELNGGLIITLSPAKYESGPPHIDIIVSPFNGLGSYDNLFVSYTEPFTNPNALQFWFSMDAAVAKPTMTMSEYVEGDYMIGHITGELNQAIPDTDPTEYLRFQLSLPFRAEFSGGVNETICEGDSL
jgi:hypothetical protein